MSGTLVVLRHGPSQANADGLFTALLDVPLSTVGRDEAERSAQLLNLAGLDPAAWFCSPLLRARQTAEILQARIASPPVIIDYNWRLAERNWCIGLTTTTTRLSVAVATWTRLRRPPQP